ncbi:carbohydrate ABC transporter permease [Georgenia deserti]|uniref:Carbohydrate ABC transporter permease n=1 Tax=Georgenia deserti TaxID=2093781 RepID=A0ABW4L869_9MICO
MTSTDVSTARPSASRRGRREELTHKELRGRWWRFALIAAVTAVVLVPIGAVVVLSLRPTLGSATTAAVTLENFARIFGETDVLLWLENSLMVSAVTVAIALIVAAPAGYVLSRGRGRLVSGFSLVLFIVQSLPLVTAVIPLFILFARLGLVDNLSGVTIVYVGMTMSVAIWMMAAYYDSIPVTLEEAAWLDGCSVFGGFLRIVLRNSPPGILSTAIFSFLLSWNDYLVALVFLRSDFVYTLPVGLQSFFQQNATSWGLVMAIAVVMMLPPVLLFTFLNKYFSIGGIGGSLAGQ